MTALPHPEAAARPKDLLTAGQILHARGALRMTTGPSFSDRNWQGR